MEQPVFKRVLLKISGEALAGDKHFGFDFDVVSKVCDVIKKCTDMGVRRVMPACTGVRNTLHCCVCHF